MYSLNQLLKEKDKKKIEEMMNALSGFEIADLISNKNPEDQLFVFKVLRPELAAETLDYLPVRVKKKVLTTLPTPQIAKILLAIPPDDRTALLTELPHSVRDEYIRQIPQKEALMTLMLLGYPSDTVGRLMTTDYIAVKMNWTLEKVLDRIREYGRDSEAIKMIYVVDDQNILLDDIEVTHFLFYPKDYRVAQISDEKFTSLSPFDKPQKAITIFETTGRTGLPVTNEKGVLLGTVTFDDILSYATKKTTKSIQKFGGMQALEEPYMNIPFFQLMRKRAQWLVIIFLGETLTATALGYFEDEISKAVVLALFLPLIISSGGNAGSQSSTLIIRAMSLGEVRIKDWWRIMKREVLSGAFLGTLLGLIGFLRVSLWTLFSDIYGSHWILLGFTIGFALLGVVLWGSLAGSMLPLLLRKVGVDPAAASAPLVASLVDVTGIIIYFSVALFILKDTLLL
jgi:magnesium transporter